MDQFIIQILLGNSDLSAKNMEVYTENSILRFSPFYDFGLYGTVNIKNRAKMGYKFQYIPLEDHEETSAYITIEKFLNNAPRKEIELFKEYLGLLQEIKTSEIFKSIKEQTECTVPKRVKKLLQNELNDNLNNVNTILKGKKI